MPANEFVRKLTIVWAGIVVSLGVGCALSFPHVPSLVIGIFLGSFAYLMVLLGLGFIDR